MRRIPSRLRAVWRWGKGSGVRLGEGGGASEMVLEKDGSIHWEGRFLEHDCRHDTQAVTSPRGLAKQGQGARARGEGQANGRTTPYHDVVTVVHDAIRG